MRYMDAKELYKEDEATVKATKTVLSVVSIEVDPKHVNVLYTDGNVYGHTEIT